MRGSLAMALVALGACVPSKGPLMEPGSDCLSCHDGAAARRWTAAGTWSGEGAHVSITDADGKSFTLRTNRVGNFYTAEPLAFPFRVSVDGAQMPTAVDYGGCNRCHALGGTIQTGPDMLPGSDCLSCHDGKGVPRFTAAGTWPPPADISITDSAGNRVPLSANQVGNFFTDVPLTFPLSVSVNGTTMEGGLSEADGASCNRCHPRAGGGGG